jgi:hypothetical protein
MPIKKKIKTINIPEIANIAARRSLSVNIAKTADTKPSLTPQQILNWSNNTIKKIKSGNIKEDNKIKDKLTKFNILCEGD